MDTGLFALEEDCDEITEHIRRFLGVKKVAVACKGLMNHYLPSNLKQAVDTKSLLGRRPL